ncbi:MAG: thiol oxidoreductase [Pseudomonadota bacterium]|nr:thiol oxidoreductase [Pseudomonadota bacterium]
MSASANPIVVGGAAAAIVAVLAIVAGGGGFAAGSGGGLFQPAPRPDPVALPPLEGFIGRSFFEDPWIAAPASTTLRDGLGPLYNAHACASCHRTAGRTPPDADALSRPPTGMVLKIGRRAGESFVPDPVYGDMLQRRALPSVAAAGVPGEARWRLEPVVVELDDGLGSVRRLERPLPRIEAFAHGEPAPGLLVSARIAPILAGIGRIERIADATLLALEDPDDRDGDGISGRAHRLPGGSAGPRLGRFGHKAAHPDLAHQVGAALRDDIGITSRLFPAEPCTAAQSACAQAASGAGPDGPHEISDALFDALVAHVASLPPPVRSSLDDAGEGAGLFRAIGCAACHVPRLPAIDGGWVALHSDLLLHDMGAGLADALGEGDAGGGEWRTAPLIGLGERERAGRAGFLHDGRADTLVDAILWHGGEAAPARERFRALDESRRDALLDYLRGL